MLQVLIPESEFFDEKNQEFIRIKGTILQLEHSLVSISKWEAKWCKPFLGKENKTNEETIDYIRCMTITQNIPHELYQVIPNLIFDEISRYINAQMTATWFNDQESTKNKEIITAEVIYYWMIAQNIPMECQKWHLNRLLTLIRVCNIKNNPPKKMGRKEMLSRRRELNEARRSQFNTKG